MTIKKEILEKGVFDIIDKREDINCPYCNEYDHVSWQIKENRKHLHIYTNRYLDCLCETCLCKFEIYKEHPDSTPQ